MENLKQQLTIPQRVRVFENIEQETYGVVMCMFCTKTQRFVILDRRSRGVYRKSFPGGTNEPGESSIECVIREVEEELGIKIVANPDTVYPIHLSRPFLLDKGAEEEWRRLRARLYLQYYLIIVPEEMQLTSEVNGGKEINPEWSSIEDIQRFADEFLIYDAKGLQKVLELFGYRLVLRPFGGTPAIIDYQADEQ